MKFLFSTICFLILFFSPTIRLEADNITHSNLSNSQSNIENGWYQATVKYCNYSTYTQSKYTLNVKVEYGRVIVIDFGNGGSVHSGYNNSGYTYSGGYIHMERDYNYNIVAAKARVTITEDFTVKTFDIIIE